ncbi:MAG: SnoaL-like domain [Solirubrobacteraceae bacterium]|jgi:ketosteroid isomerase-like protein|nr:SnoaL-like domain [Solirubrobacteraceae bacterium]
MDRPDVVRRFYTAFSERDLPAMLDTLDPGIAFEPVLGVLYDRHIFHGHAEIIAWFEDLAADWDAFESHVDSALDVGDHVVAFVRLVARRGDQTLEAEIAVECGFEGDRISSFTGRDAWAVAEELGRPREC